MPDSNDETGFEGLGKLTDDSDIDPEDVETPSDEELEELSVLELKEEYGPFADLYLEDE